jgi:hypothetical protein
MFMGQSPSNFASCREFSTRIRWAAVFRCYELTSRRVCTKLQEPGHRHGVAAKDNDHTS